MKRTARWRGAIWRGDLVASVIANDENAARLIAANLGLVEQEAVEEISREEDVPVTGTLGPAEEASVASELSSAYPEYLEDIHFWQPFRYTGRTDIKPPPPPPEHQEESTLKWTFPPQSPPSRVSICEKQVSHPRLRTALSRVSPGRGVDLDRVVRRLARAETLYRFPRKQLRRWGQNILVVLDRSDRLVPFFADQELLCDQLEALTPANTIKQLFTIDPDGDFVHVDPIGDLADFEFDTPSRIVVLGDLGVLQSGRNSRLRQRWFQWGRNLVDQGFQLVALVPYPVSVAGSELRQVFSLVSWQRSPSGFVHDRIRRAQLVDRLLAAASPAIRLEPGLLRSLRMLDPETIDASLESDVWQHPAIRSPHEDAADLDREVIETHFQSKFAALPSDHRATILSVLREWRFHCLHSPEIWFEEILNLDSDSQELVRKLFPGDLEDALAGIHYLAKQAKVGAESRYLRALRDYGGRAAGRLAERAWEDNRIRQAVHDLWSAAPVKPRRNRPVDPALLGGQSEEAVRLTLVQQGRNFRFAVGRQNIGAFVGAFWTRNRCVTLHPFNADKRAAFWISGTPPGWAHDWGRDEYGAWATFRIPWSGKEDDRSSAEQTEQFVTQRLRWIRPGTFLMGSPDDEAGRHADEGPQHQVTLTQGFWMFDTPVTQELWQAVMGKNPSHFKGDRRPVESVSWDDAQRFLDRLNEKLSEAVFTLPTEAEWEYACRAGTTTRYAFGDELSSEQAHFDSGDGTVPVGSYAPNDWGLFDMHGNVRECCQDFWSDDYSQAEAIDPAGPVSGHDRVVRGGGWVIYAQNVRSAFRYRSDPGYRNARFGFRCAQVPGAGEPKEEEGQAAEPTASPTNEGGIPLQIEPHAPRNVEIPAASAIIVRSDVDDLELRRVPRPDWATAMGRDRYGLWAEFRLDMHGIVDMRKFRERLLGLGMGWLQGLVDRWGRSPKTASHPITQRMRWIPPGRFLMGSDPEDRMADSNEHPQHEVILSHGYWLFDTPVTQEVWAAIMQENQSAFRGERRPVENVTWDDCQDFLNRINLLFAGLGLTLELTLPTEAEWEYACRAGTTTRYAFGETISPGQANYYVEDAVRNAETSIVGSFAPNSWGLFDMHGNVWEWCQDWYAAYPAAGQVDPQGPAEGLTRVVRGGSWFSFAQRVRSASRSRDDPGVRGDGIGFRCAQVHPASRQASK